MTSVINIFFGALWKFGTILKGTLISGIFESF